MNFNIIVLHKYHYVSYRYENEMKIILKQFLDCVLYIQWPIIELKEGNPDKQLVREIFIIKILGTCYRKSFLLFKEHEKKSFIVIF